MLIAAMGALLPEDMQRMNAAKNLLSLIVNIVAAVAFTVVAFDRISWLAAGLIAVGSLIGGFLGAHYGRRLSPNALRAVIVVVGLIGLYRLLTDLARRLPNSPSGHPEGVGNPDMPTAGSPSSHLQLPLGSSSSRSRRR